MSELKNQTVKGIEWSASDAFIGQGINFLVTLVLSRKLLPEEYGLIGYAVIFTSILTGFVDSGFSNALIRKTDANDKDYNTMFLTNLSISILMYALLFFCAPPIAAFFNSPELNNVLRVLGLILIIQALSLVQNTILTIRIDFKTKTKASLISAIISGATGITLAFSGFGVWALVAQQLTCASCNTIFLYAFNRWRPKFTFYRNSFTYMWGFGWKLLLSGLLDRTWTQLYDFVIGKFYLKATLGNFTRAKQFAQIFSANFTQIVQRVTYPVLAKIQNDDEALVAAYRKIIKVTMFVTAISMISMGAVAEPMIRFLIGDNWMMAASFLPILCISMSLYPLHAINLNMLQVQGRSDIFLKLEIIKKIISIAPLCLGIFIDIYWMLIGSIFTSVIAFFLNSYYMSKKMKYTSIQQLIDIAPSYGIALVIALSVYFIKYLPLSCFVVFPLQIIVGAGVFFLICETIKPEEYIELKGIAQSYWQKIRHKKG